MDIATTNIKGQSATRFYTVWVSNEVEGCLQIHGNAMRSWGYSRTPFLTREEAWAICQGLKRIGASAKVYARGEVVCFVSVHADGRFVKAVGKKAVFKST